MIDSEFLSPAEVKALAGGCSRLVDQAETLREQGIPHRLVGKRLVVSRYHVREWLAGRLAPARASQGEFRLDLVK
jgi:hypothetical protein